MYKREQVNGSKRKCPPHSHPLMTEVIRGGERCLMLVVKVDESRH